MPDDHRHLLHLDERRILCSCEPCWALHSGDPEYRPAGMRTRLARGLRVLRRAVGRVPDPDRPRLLHAQRHDRRGGGVLPEPGRGDRVRARPRRLGRARAGEPARWATSSPTARRWSSTASAMPPQYVIAPIDECYRLVGHDQVALGGHLRRARRSRARCPSSSTRLRARARRVRRDRAMSVQPETAVTAVPAPELDGHQRGARAPCRGTDAGLRGRASSSPRATTIYTIALTAQIQIDPARRGYDPDTRERLQRAVRAARALGAATTQSLRGRASTRSCRLHRLDHVRARGAVHLRPRGGGGQVLLRARRRRGAARASTSPARSSTAARTGGCRWCWCRGAPAPSSGCRSRRGGR